MGIGQWAMGNGNWELGIGNRELGISQKLFSSAQEHLKLPCFFPPVPLYQALHEWYELLIVGY
ncbi:MAG: hypothetical protein KME30_11865 [Iphinoe sp. HA4291-MV1]|nr:hypothetical protein [Iphinoe sp. HA4291-MV1]